MTFTACEFETAWEAIQHRNVEGRGAAIYYAGRNLVVDETDADRLTAAGVEFAYLTDRPMRDGTFRIMTVPVND